MTCMSVATLLQIVFVATCCTSNMTFLINVNVHINFLRCNAMHKCGLCHHAVSVCLSHLWIMSKTNKHIFDIFSPLGSHTILVFPYQTGWRYSDGNPPDGGVECKGGMKKWRFTSSFCVVYALHCEINSGLNTTKNINDYNNVRSEIRFFVLELFNCLRSEVRKCK